MKTRYNFYTTFSVVSNASINVMATSILVLAWLINWEQIFGNSDVFAFEIF